MGRLIYQRNGDNYQEGTNKTAGVGLRAQSTGFANHSLPKESEGWAKDKRQKSQDKSSRRKTKLFQPQSGEIFVEEEFYSDLAPEQKTDRWVG